MRSFLKGVAIAFAVGALAPRVTTFTGASGADDRGHYYYDGIKFMFGRWGVEVAYWSEIPVKS